ncbi:hypothetical protein K3495_g6302 [Podosphaera aphanis]|nr:hypothetical protein K3495_g6302 [Podosphaera aphanis]
MASINLDQNYGYVLLAATSTFILNSVHALNTSSFRKAAGVPYPASYAPDSRTDKPAFRFNCAQRSHVNFIENQPSTLGAMLIGGLRFPQTAALLGAGWSISRFLYMTGYSRGDEGGKGRFRGIIFFLFQYALIGIAGYTGGAMVMGW